MAADLDAPPVQEIARVTQDRITQGCKILSFLTDKAMIHRFISRWYELGEGTGAICIEFIMKEWLQKLWQHHGVALATQNPDKIRRLSELIWRNTQQPLVFNDKTTALEWARLATGQNLRWEVVGLIAVNVGLCVNCLDSSDQFVSEHKVTRQGLSKKMMDVAQTCLNFARECEMLGDIFVWLLLEYSALMAVLKGDENYACYLASGEVNNACISMGLHQGVKANGAIPFFLSELRKRTFTVVYSMEISVAAFLGRPPRLSYRHCVLEAPLDLSDHQLYLEGRELDAAIAELDADGFNKTGQIQRSSWIRTWLGFAQRREDIVELALGYYTRDEVLERAATIRAKTDQHWNNLPLFLRRTRDDDIDFTRMRPLQALFYSVVRQGSRANDLLLQRVLIRKTGASSEKLIAVAQAIFKDVLQITQRHDIASMFQMDFTALLVAHGLRSGAIVAVELLKQEQLPVYPEKPLLPRSQTIQDLSIFAARLGTIDPSDGTFSMCDQGRKVITRILDKILTPNPAASQQQPPQPHQLHPQQQGLGPMYLDASTSQIAPEAGLGNDASVAPAVGVVDGPISMEPMFGYGQDIDFIQWLESMDWEKGDTWRTDTWNGH